jgi:hypothetical protein
MVFVYKHTTTRPEPCKLSCRAATRSLAISMGFYMYLFELLIFGLQRLSWVWTFVFSANITEYPGMAQDQYDNLTLSKKVWDQRLNPLLWVCGRHWRPFNEQVRDAIWGLLSLSSPIRSYILKHVRQNLQCSWNVRCATLNVKNGE